ncbi:uncharacterized protein TNCT_240661 [Trichonephila clavata]|uniref:Uncharacterized protein n=1 Tax=Trichonephila clavata TaxID=2740835 RepID=A0A8X6FIF2_TRICU|nr:uncharacterized protein TNCT_240661 [Trichonephila clavata]
MSQAQASYNNSLVQQQRYAWMISQKYGVSDSKMANGKLSLLVVTIIISIKLFGASDAWPQMDYSYESHIPSGVLRPISGVVPITVNKQPPSGPESRVLRRIRHKVDKSHVRELDFSIQQDLSQDVKIPNGCSDRYSIRDGVIKHLLRGGRDVIVAVFRDVQDLINYNIGGIPLAPNIVNGVSKAVTDILCGGEDAASDLTNYLDTLIDLITSFLMDLLEFKGRTLLSIPRGLLNVTELASKLAVTIIQDLVGATEKGVIDLGSELESGLEELVGDIASDVGGIVNKVENVVGSIISGVGGGVKGIVGKVGKGVRSIAGGVEKGVGSLATGVENAVNDILGACK